MLGSRLAVVVACGLATLLVGIASAGSSRETQVVFLTENTGCAGAFMEGVCRGFLEAVKDTGVEGRVLTPTLHEDPVVALGLIANQRYDLVTAFGGPFPFAMSAVAPKHPKKRFVLIDRSYSETTGQPRNVQGVVFRTSEAAYLAGWLAARMEQRRPGPDAVGVVAGFRLPSVDDFVIGFRAGARRAAPGIRVLVGYSNEFLDRSKCEAVARRQAAQGAGALFNVAGVCGLGTLDVARERGIWGIGVDTDQSFLGPHVLTSVLKDFHAGFLTILQAAKKRPLKTGGGDTVLDLRDGAVGLGKVSPRVPAALRAELERLERRVAAGEIRVPGAFPSQR